MFRSNWVIWKHVHDFVDNDTMACVPHQLPFKFWSSIAFSFWITHFGYIKKLIHNCHVLTKMDIPKPFWSWDSTTLSEIGDLSRQLCQMKVHLCKEGTTKERLSITIAPSNLLAKIYFFGSSFYIFNCNLLYPLSPSWSKLRYCEWENNKWLVQILCLLIEICHQKWINLINCYL